MMLNLRKTFLSFTLIVLVLSVQAQGISKDFGATLFYSHSSADYANLKKLPGISVYYKETHHIFELLGFEYGLEYGYYQMQSSVWQQGFVETITYIWHYEEFHRIGIPLNIRFTTFPKTDFMAGYTFGYVFANRTRDEYRAHHPAQNPEDGLVRPLGSSKNTYKKKMLNSFMLGVKREFDIGKNTFGVGVFYTPFLKPIDFTVLKSPYRFELNSLGLSIAYVVNHTDSN